MSLSITAQKNALATAYGSAAPNGALFSSDPGTTGSVVGELTGGNPVYARQSLGWGAPNNGVINGSANFNVPSGQTVAYFGPTVSATAGTSDLRDKTAVTSQPFASQGTYAVTATFTVS